MRNAATGNAYVVGGALFAFRLSMVGYDWICVLDGRILRAKLKCLSLLYTWIDRMDDFSDILEGIVLDVIIPTNFTEQLLPFEYET